VINDTIRQKNWENGIKTVYDLQSYWTSDVNGRHLGFTFLIDVADKLICWTQFIVLPPEMELTHSPPHGPQSRIGKHNGY
jgi:hypothetical protein